MNQADLEILHESLKQKDRDGNVKHVRPPEHAVRLLEETCERTGLSWKQRHIYLLERGGKWGVTLSIDGFRLVANSDDKYNGQAGPFWTMGPDKPWTDIPPENTPYAAKVGVYRKGQSEPTWGVAKFADYSCGTPMWKKMGGVMIAKCAEMLGLRKALPGKLGGLYGIEEMEQAGVKVPTAAAAEDKGTDSQPPTKPRVKKLTATVTKELAETAEAGGGLTGVSSDHGGELPPETWETRINGAKTLGDLKSIGMRIQANADIQLEEKMRLNVIYGAMKALFIQADKADKEVASV